MNVTIKDVAKVANVSHGTVSRYINGYKLGEENSKRVQEAIEALGYKQNIMAKGLKCNRSMTVGVVIRELTDIFNTSIVSHLEKVLERQNYSIVLCDYEDDPKRQVDKLKFLLDRSIDGLVFFSRCEQLDILNEYVERKIPIVLINDDVPGLPADRVMVDNVNASFRAIEKLIHLNHTKIGIINSQTNINESVGPERYKGYADAHEIYNIPIKNEYIKDGKFRIQGGYNAAKELLSLSDPPTALYITNFHMTIGAYMAINEMGIRVPQDLSVIGFDYFENFEVIRPQYSYIEQQIQRIGETAASLVLKRINGDYSGYPCTERINTKMVITDSIRKL